jgi:2-methylcitrate dehydratase PrpD
VARLARRGFVGPSEILEGPQGLYAAMTEQPAPLLLSEGWRMDEVSFKPWAACRHAHPAIDAALQLKNQGVLAGPVVVETYSDAITFCDRPSPATVIDAKFSIQHALAVVAVRGEPRLEDFEPEAINHPELVAMRALIEVREAQDITARYPAHFGARVSAGGSTLELIDTLGDPERPLDDEGVKGKARQLVAWGGLSDLDADRAVDIALHGNNAVPLLHLLEEWL